MARVEGQPVTVRSTYRIVPPREVAQQCLDKLLALKVLTLRDYERLTRKVFARLSDRYVP
jgi:hypothetical protein